MKSLHDVNHSVSFVESAQSGDFQFVKKIRESFFSGKVHSVFRKAINIYCEEDGELYTLLTKQLDNAPNSIITCFEDFMDKAEVGCYVTSKNGNLYFEKRMLLKCQDTRLWKPGNPVMEHDGKTLDRHMKIAKDYVSKNGSSLLQLEMVHDPIKKEIARQLKEKSTLLIDKCKANQLEEATSIATQLIGLGVGLTPSGDDFLVGFISILRLVFPFRLEYDSFIKEVLEYAKNKTNLISYMALKKAGEGEVRESIYQFILSLCHGIPEKTVSTLEKVMSIGATSGADIAHGILAGIELYLSNEEDKNVS